MQGRHQRQPHQCWHVAATFPHRVYLFLKSRQDASVLALYYKLKNLASWYYHFHWFHENLKNQIVFTGLPALSQDVPTKF